MEGKLKEGRGGICGFTKTCSLVILGVITSTTKHHYQGLRAASVAYAHEGIYVFELITRSARLPRTLAPMRA